MKTKDETIKAMELRAVAESIAPDSIMARVAELEAAAKLAEPDDLRAEVARLTTECEEHRSRAAAMRDERDALRAIIEGRTVAPTYEEAVAHRKARGWWRWRSEGGHFGTAEVPDQAVDVGDTYGPCRWWAHDASDAPCAWPVATEAPKP